MRKTTSFLALQYASEVFLKNTLPDNWEAMSNDEQSDFLTESVWGPFEHFDIGGIMKLIQDHACNLEDFLIEASKNHADNLIKVFSEASIKQPIDVTLNSFDDRGNIVDTTTMGLSSDSVSDIVDHAAQLAIVMRESNGVVNQDVKNVMAELESALETAGVL